MTFPSSWNSIWQSFPAHNILEFNAFSLERVWSKLVASITTGSALSVPLTVSDPTRWSLWLEPSWDQTAGSGKKTSGPLWSPLKTCPLIIFVSVSEQVSGNYAESSLPLQGSGAVSLWHSDGVGYIYTSEVYVTMSDTLTGRFWPGLSRCTQLVDPPI